MSLTVLLSPASSGKTTWAVSKAWEEARGLKAIPRLVVPSQIQVHDCNIRLAELGGSMGVRILTFEELAWQIIEGTAHFPIRIKENIQNHIIRYVMAELDLEYYAGIQNKPGFGQKVLEIIRELKAGAIGPDQFVNGVYANSLGPRLSELGEIYQAYENRAKQWNLIDSNGAIALAEKILEEEPELIMSWGVLLFDGFDDFSPVQVNLIKGIAGHIDPVYLTLTGGESTQRSALIHKRFLRVLEIFSRDERIKIHELSEFGPARKEEGPLLQLRENLFLRDKNIAKPSADELTMTAVPDREAEVRTALRWIKNLEKDQGVSPGNSAILVRSQETYRMILSRVAEEYDLNIRIIGGFPLKENPLIASILRLLEVVDAGVEDLTWREVIGLWQSPYFNWKNIYLNHGVEYSNKKHAHYRLKLKDIAHWGTIVRGIDQWIEVFDLLLTGDEDFNQEQGRELNPVGLTARETRELRDLFLGLCKSITAPVEKTSAEVYVSWLEDFLGIKAEEGTSSGIGLIDQILSGEPHLQQRDWKAAQELIRILREVVWANELLGQEELSFSQFYSDLDWIIGTSTYQAEDLDRQAIICADITEARGLSFEAVALLGLGEGEFPGTIKEDPFLRDEDRILLSGQPGINLQLSTESAESEFFYEAIGRAVNYLHLTRPRLAENGSSWQPSPFWEEVLRCVDLSPSRETTRSKPPETQAGSVAEYLEILAGKFDFTEDIWTQAFDQLPAITRTIQQASKIIGLRSGSVPNQGSIYDGDLERLGARITEKFPDDHIWSSSRLETYQSCPFHFLASYLLNLEKPEPPSEGLDARQLGNIYHHILEKTYREVGEGYSLEVLLQKLPEAAQAIFKKAPVREGFRETAWWEKTKQEILTNLKRSLIVLENIDPSYEFYRAEQSFGISRTSNPHLTVRVDSKRSFNLRGFIDRVDKNPSGDIRIIDYKTSGAYGFSNQAIRDGKKLQLPLYALAAQDALDLGPVKDGFYFHLQSAQASSLKLASYRDGGNMGPSAAMERSSERGWEAIQMIRNGKFIPVSPESGCPEYCPAVGFCWAYQPGFW